MSLIDLKISKAHKLIKKGKLTNAREIFEQILKEFPKNSRAINGLNELSTKKNKTSFKLDLDEESEINEILLLYKRKLVEEAYKRAMKIYEKFSQNEKLNNVIGCIHDDKKDYEKAKKFYKKALDINPNSSEALANLGVSYINTGDIETAISCYRKSININPDYTLANCNLATAYTTLGKYEEAISLLTKAISKSPNNAVLFNNLGYAYKLFRKDAEAQNCFKKAIELKSDSVEAHTNYAVFLLERGDYKKAIDHFEHSLLLDANNIVTMINLGVALGDVGRDKEAIKYFKNVIDQKPDEFVAISNLLLQTNYSPEYTHETSSIIHKKYGELIEKNCKFKFTSYKKINSAQKIKLGFVSADLFQHSISYFLKPLFLNIDKSKFEIHCFSNSFYVDDTTKLLQNLSDFWYEVEHLTDKNLSNFINEKNIDILIDLSGHTQKNRLPMFAMKPSKVQITWLGYPNTTGLKSIDYRIVDEFTDPKNIGDNYSTEKLIRMKNCFLCFSPDEDIKIEKNTYFNNDQSFILGSFNNLTKMSEEVIKCWSEILLANNKTKIILKNKQLNSNYMRNIYLKKFLKYGVKEDQIILLSWSKSRQDHLNLYNSIDLALDTFPYNGTTTTFEALWMGVPVLCLEGKNHAARVSFSILKNLNLDTFISQTQQEYIQKSIYYSYNKDSLKQLSLGIRDKLKASSLCDATNYTKEFEIILENLIR